MRRLLEKKDKKGQVISIIGFFVIFLGVLILGVILMSLVNTILHPVATQFSAQSTQAGASVTSINDTFNKWWDIALTFMFVINVVILFLSSYFVDTHPIFLIVYVIAAFILLVFGGNMVSSQLNTLWDTSGINGAGNVTEGGNVLGNLPITVWMLNNFTIVLLSIVVISGVIMYAKLKYGNGGGSY